MSTNVRYMEIDPTAAGDASLTAPTGFAHNDDGLIDGHAMKPYITAEWHSWGLDGSRELMQDADTVAWWDDDISGADCSIASPPTFVIAFGANHSTVGVSLEFDTALAEWCTEVNIKWYSGSTLLADEDFEPDSPLFFCEQTVTGFNKIELTLNKTSHPYRRAKLNCIVFGLIRDFDAAQLRAPKVVAQCNLVSAELPASKFTWTLIDDGSVDNMFQFKQPVEITHDNDLLGVFYIDTSKRVAKDQYTIECIDALGVLDSSYYAGAVYSSNTSAQAMVEAIVGDEFDLIFEATDVTLKGAILPNTKRKALQQVLFAWGACAATDGVRGIRIFDLPTTPTTKDPDEIYDGGAVEKTAIVTQINITTHSYSQSSSGTIVINGNKYNDTTGTYTWDNPAAQPTDKPNVVNVTDATLINSNNAAALATRLANWYAMREVSKTRIVWDGERLGDRIIVDNAWLDPREGNIRVLEMNLSNIIAATVEVQG